MDERMSPFSYLLEDAEEEFFQKTAEDIAQETARPPSAFVLPTKDVADILSEADDSQATKLAELLVRSNMDGLRKEARLTLSLIPDDYNTLVNSLAASAPMESLGMSKTAVEYFTALEGFGLDIEKIASRVLLDTLQVDVALEAAFAKTAGVIGDFNQISLELSTEITDEILKEASPPVAAAKAGSRLWKIISGGGRAVGQGATAVGQGARAVGKAVAAPARATRAAAAARSAVSKVTTPIRGAYRKWRMGSALKKQQALQTPIRKLRRDRLNVIAKMNSPKFTEAQKAGLTAKRDAIEKQIAKLKPARVKAKKNLAQKRRQLEAQTTKGKKKATGAAEKAKSQVTKAEGAGPTRPPASAVEGKGVGVLDAWKRWGKVGWGGLTAGERAKLTQAGIIGAVGARATGVV